MISRSKRGLGKVAVRNAKSSLHQDPNISRDALRSISDFLGALSDTKEMSTQELNSIVRASMFHANSLSPENITKLLRFIASSSMFFNGSIYYPLVEIVDKRLLQRYSEKVSDSNLERYTSTDLATILNSFCRLGYIQHDLFHAVADYLTSRPNTYNIPERSLGMIYNAFARANIYKPDLFDKLSIFLNKSLPTVSTHTAGNICHALGKLRIKTPSAIEDVSKIASHVLKNHASRLTPQELSNILYSLGNMGIQDPELTEPLVQIAKRKVRKLNPIEVAAICTSLTKLAIADDSLMKQIANLVESNQSRYSAYELVAVLHAFSQLDTIVPQKLFTDVLPAVISDDIDPKTACIAFNAYARIGIHPPSSITTTLKTSILGTSDSQYLINVLFSAGQLYSDNLSEQDSQFITALCQSIHSSPVINPINCTQLIFALNKLGKTESPLYNQVVSGAIGMIPDFEVNQISNILYGFSLRSSQLRDFEMDLATGLIASRKIAADATPQLVSSIAESVASLGLGDTGVWETFTRAVITKCPDDSKIDVRTLAAVLRQDKVSSEELVSVIAKRMNVGKLSSDDLTRCLRLIVDHKIDVPDLSLKIYTAVIERIETVLNLNEVFSLMNLMNEPKRFPADMYTAEDRNCEGGNFADLCCRLDERFASFVSADEKIEYSVSALKDLRHVRNDSLRQAVTDQLLGILKGGNVGLETLARVSKFLSPQYDKSLSRVVKEALVREGGNLGVTKHTLRIASALLRIDSPELCHLLMDEYIPIWLKAMVDRYAESVREWVASCPVAISSHVAAIAIQVFSEGEKVDLKTYCMLGGGQKLVVDTDRVYSVEELADVAMIANRDSRERLVAEAILRIRPSLENDVRRDVMMKYIREVGLLVRHIDVSKCDCSGAKTVTGLIILKPFPSFSEKADILKLAISVEHFDVLHRIVRSLLLDGRKVPNEQAQRFRDLFGILVREYQMWFANQFTSSESKELHTLLP